MKCDRYLRLISQMLDNEISPRDKKELDEHLKDCSSCTTFYMQAQKADESITQAYVPPVSLPDVNFEKKGRLYRLVTVAGSAVVVLLFAILISPLMFNSSTGNKAQYSRATVEKVQDSEFRANEPSGTQYLKKEKTSVSGGSESLEKKKEPMLIREKTVSLEVKKVDRAYQEIYDIVRWSGGFVSSSSFERGNKGNATGAKIVVRIPNDRFENAFVKIQETGLLKTTGENAQDITRTFVDNKARIKNLKLKEQWYQRLMDKAETTSELMEIEEKISEIRGEIEQLQGENAYYKDITSYISLSINLTTKNRKKSPSTYNPILKMISSYLREAVTNAVTVTGALLSLLGAILPLLLVGMVVGYAVKLIKRKK